MTESEIDNLINTEFKVFNDALFDLEQLPKNIVEMFKVAVFKLPAKVHQLSPDTIRRIMDRKLKEVTNLDVPIMINAIQQLPMCEYGNTLEEALEKYTKIESLKIGYSLMVQKINSEMSAKRENMLRLNNPTKQPLKLVKAQA